MNMNRWFFNNTLSFLVEDIQILDMHHLMNLLTFYNTYFCKLCSMFDKLEKMGNSLCCHTFDCAVHTWFILVICLPCLKLVRKLLLTWMKTVWQGSKHCQDMYGWLLKWCIFKKCPWVLSSLQNCNQNIRSSLNKT